MVGSESQPTRRAGQLRHAGAGLERRLGLLRELGRRLAATSVDSASVFDDR